MLDKSKYKVIGVMSGTSLDGLDLAYCTFQQNKTGWKFDIEQCTTVRYPARWLAKLGMAHEVSGQELMALDAEYGSYIGKEVLAFAEQHRIRPHFIASHGHTVFHQPSNGFTTQIGNGYSLFASSGFPVVCDFRMLDVALGGEGAPLVPVGDKLLFHDYDVCLNLGGIANLSVDLKGKRLAYDICFCNMPLNILAAEANKKYDRNGEIAAQGEVDEKLLKALEKVYRKYHSKRPSLGREIFEKDLATLLQDKKIPLSNRLATFTESTAVEICRAIKDHRTEAKVLCTGGGAFNAFMISRLLEYGGDEVTFIIPDDEVVKFKEALVFGFLGVLRVRNEVNCLKSVTKASRDNCSGSLIGFA